MKLEGIYRLSAPKSLLDQLKARVDAGETALAFEDAHAAACLLKMYLRELPDSLFGELLPKFEQTVQGARSTLILYVPRCAFRVQE